MTRVVDIFRTLPDGSTRWVEAIEGLEDARQRMKELNRQSSGHYFIYFEQNGIVQREDYPPVHAHR